MRAGRPSARLRLAASWVGAHGATDALALGHDSALPRLVSAYASGVQAASLTALISGLASTPSARGGVDRGLAVLLTAAGAFHFSLDSTTLWVKVCVVAFTITCAVLRLELPMLIYMAVVHTPCHYVRVSSVYAVQLPGSKALACGIVGWVAGANAGDWLLRTWRAPPTWRVVTLRTCCVGMMLGHIIFNAM